MAVSALQVEQLYLAYFGRPADPGGLAFFTSDPGATISSVASAFSASPESQALYGGIGASQINAIYQNLFNRDAELAGLTYWTSQVVSGALSPAAAAYAILLGAQNDDAVMISNKLAAAASFTAALRTADEAAAYAGASAADTARGYLHEVTANAATLGAAQNLTDAIVGQIVGNHLMTAGTTLTVAGPLATGTSVVLSSGTPDAIIQGGVADGASASVSGLGPSSVLEVDGSVLSQAALHMSSLFSDAVLNFESAPRFPSDWVSISQDKAPYVLELSFSGVTSLNIDSTAIVSGVATPQPPGSVLLVAGQTLATIHVTGDEPVSIRTADASLSTVSLPALTTVDASQLTAPNAISPIYGDQKVGFQFLGLDTNTDVTQPYSPENFIIGSAHCANELWGSISENVIVGGPLDDVIVGAAGADTLTGGGGNNIFVYDIFDSTPDAPDVITDFHPNTVGVDLAGAPQVHGAPSQSAMRNGDVIEFPSLIARTISVAVVDSADAAAQFLLTAAAARTADVDVALDSTTGMLYVDPFAWGKAQVVIELNGVKTITQAAFLMG